MKILLLSFTIIIIFYNTAFAIPLPGVFLAYDMILLSIPYLITFFGLIYIYFRKYSLLINLIISIIFVVTFLGLEIITHNGNLFFEHDFILLIATILSMIISFKISKNHYFHHIFSFLLLSATIISFLGAINMYQYISVYNNLSKNETTQMQVVDYYLDYDYISIIGTTRFGKTSIILYKDRDVKSTYYTQLGDFYIYYGSNQKGADIIIEILRDELGK